MGRVLDYCKFLVVSCLLLEVLHDNDKIFVKLPCPKYYWRFCKCGVCNVTILATHLDIVSGPHWNHSRISQVTPPVWHKWRKIATCSSFIMCFKSSRPAYIWSSWTSFWKTCLDIPRLSWNRTVCPFKSSCSQSSPESLELYIGVLIRWGIMYCITAAPPATADRKAAVLSLCCCWSCTDFCSALVLVDEIRAIFAWMNNTDPSQ